MIARLYACRRGATAIEYALMLMIAALVIVTALTTMGQKTASPFNAVAAAMN